MLNNKDILYLKQGNRETIIYTIKEKIVIREPIEKVINKWCLDSLTTYQGRLDAIKQKYRLKKLVPIYIDKELMLFPIDNKQKLDNVYINSLNILEIDKLANQTKIVFKNKEYLIIDKKYQLINNYYQRCLKIYNLI